MMTVTTITVGGTSIAMIQSCTLGLLKITIGQVKNMDQGKQKENMFTQETVLVL